MRQHQGREMPGSLWAGKFSTCLKVSGFIFLHIDLLLNCDGLKINSYGVIPECLESQENIAYFLLIFCILVNMQYISSG